MGNRISDNLELRLLQLADATELFALTDANRSYLRQWLPWLDFVTQVDDTQNFIAKVMKQFAEYEGLAAAICDGGRIVGLVGFNRIDRQDRIGYIGYWLAESAGGKGIMTKSCRSLINYGFTELKLDYRWYAPRKSCHCVRHGKSPQSGNSAPAWF